MEMRLEKGKQLTRKTMRLKDYLLDELSSCSSSGFRSYPRLRQQCCATVRLDLKKKPPTILKNPSTKSSVIQRASNALINAVKHLPFTSSGATTLSRKLLKRCFSKKNENVEIPVEKKCRSSEISIAGSSNSSSSMSESYSWSGSDFTVSTDEFLRCSSEVKNLNESSVENNGRQVNHKIAAAIDGGDDSVEAAATDCSSSSSKQQQKPLRIEEEIKHKQQLSPVSVLDCPFEDDEDEVSSSPLQPRIALVKGSKMKNSIKKLDRLTMLEPMNLEKQIALSESDQDSSASPLYASSQSSSEEEDQCSKVEEEEEENNSDINKAFELLDQLIRSTTMVKLNVAEKLLLDFFKEEIEIGPQHTPMGLIRGVVVCDNELLNKVNDWLKGKPRELVLEGEVKKCMETCLRDMEREGKWRTSDEEVKEMVLELEADVFASLVEELLYDHY